MHNLLETSAKSAINLDDGCDESVGTTRHQALPFKEDFGSWILSKGLAKANKRGLIWKRPLVCEVTTCSPPERTNRPHAVGVH